MVNKDVILKDVEAIFKRENTNDFKGDMRVFYEVKNYKEINERFFKLSEVNNIELSIELIINFYNILIKDCLEEDSVYKEQKCGLTGEYEEKDLLSLIENTNVLKTNDNSVLREVSNFYCWFLKYGSPFIYGNEKVGRILMNFLLIKKEHPPIIFFESDIYKYCSALEWFNETEDISKMVSFLEEEVYKTWIKSHYLRLRNLKDFLN